MNAPDGPAPIAGIVLAAGLSRRLGSNKLLAEVDGVPLVRRTVESAIQAGLSPVLVVVGHDRERVEAALRGLGCTPVFNPRYDVDGSDGSLKAGLSAVPADAAGAMTVLGDMPRVTSEMMRRLIAEFRRDEALVVLSRYGEVYAPPMVYDRSLFGEFLEMGPGEGKRILLSQLDYAAIIDWPEEALLDLDTLADAEALDAELEGDASN